jgi:hypothetical protein
MSMLSLASAVASTHGTVAVTGQREESSEGIKNPIGPVSDAFEADTEVELSEMNFREANKQLTWMRSHDPVSIQITGPQVVSCWPTFGTWKG